MNYCSACGGSVRLRVPPRRQPRTVRVRRLRHGALHQPEDRHGHAAGGRTVPCSCAAAPSNPARAVGPLPAGFLETGRDGTSGRRRCAKRSRKPTPKVEINGLYTVFNLPHISQIYFFFRARLLGSFAAGEETLEARLFEQERSTLGRTRVPGNHPNPTPLFPRTELRGPLPSAHGGHRHAVALGLQSRPPTPLP